MTGKIALATALLVSLLGAASAAPTPSPLEFPPNCVCDRNLQHSPYRLGYDSMSANLLTTKYCFKVSVASCDPAVYCCNNQQLFKVEFDVGELL